MKKSLISAAVVAALTLSLAGCDDSPSDEEVQAEIESQAKADTMKQMADDEAELRPKLEELKQKDPSVTDAYYSYGEDGVKELHVIRENKDKEGNSSSSDSVWPLVAGMAGGYLLGSMMASGGVQNYSNQTPPRSYQSGFTREEEKKRRNGYSSSYISTATAMNANSYRSSPSRLSAIKSTVSTRSSGVFSSSSSARASSHSGSSSS